MARGQRNWGSLLALVVVCGLAGMLFMFFWQDRHQARCSRAVEQAEELAKNGQLRRALKVLDSVDVSCDCSQFTEGDEPPEYAAVRTYLVQYRAVASQAEFDEVVAQARGPMLREIGATIGR